MLTRSTTLEVVYRAIRDLLIDPPLPEGMLCDTAVFADLGINSLMLARLIVALEDELEVDPFDGELSIVDVHTVGELVDAYDAALGGDTAKAAS